MSDISIRKSRYPGVVAFEEKQQELFFGRKTETKELTQLLKAERTIVLYAKSGVGKSSLLNAGLIPHMHAEGFYPIKVRFQYTGDKLDKDVIRKTPLKIADEVIRLKISQPEGITLREDRDVLFDSQQPRLWELFKRLEFPSYIPKSTGREQILQAFRQEQSAITGAPSQPLPAEASHKMVPVLIFDQFEEFFNFSTGERHDFLVQLSELLHEMCPNRILEWLRSQPPETRTPEMVEWSKQPLIKCIFAIRDDKLAELDGIRKYIPLILRNRYRLSPLDYNDAREAMTEPAKVEGEFVSPNFTFDEKLLDTILRKLCGKAPELSPLISQPPQDNGQRGNGVDGSQLQKICSYIEHKVIERHKLKPALKIVVDETLIKQEEAEQILDRFYEDQLRKIGNEKDIDICRRIIEDHLVAGGGRASLTDNQMKNLLKDRPDLLDKMMDVRLVREEFTHLGRTYELSHDTLVKAVTKYAEQHREERLRKDKERQVRYKLLFLGLSLVSLGCVIWVLQMAAKNERILNKSKGWLAEKYYTENNHYMAFRLWSSYQRVGLFDTKAKDSVYKLLDARFFFDISGGTDLQVLNPNAYVTLEAENRVNIWRTPEDGSERLTLKTIPDALSLEVSNTNRYFICRDKAGRLIVYDANTRNAFSIPHAQLKYSNGTDKSSSTFDGADLKAGFLGASDFIWYITEAGDTYLFDLGKRKKIDHSFTEDLPSTDPKNDEDVNIVYRMKLSPDNKLLAVFNVGLLRIYNMADTKKPVLEDSVKGITWFDVNKHKDWLVYGTSSDLYASSYLNGWKHAAATHIPYTFKLAVADSSRLVYSSKAGELTIYNLIAGRIDTVIADYARRPTISYSTVVRNPDQPRSFACLPGGILRYANGQGKTLFYSFASRTYLPGLSTGTTFSATAKYYSGVDAQNQLRVFASAGGRELFHVKLLRANAYIFNDGETRLAYLKGDGTENGLLEMISLPTAKVIGSQAAAAKFSLVDIPGDNIVKVQGEGGGDGEANGIIFLNNEKRGYDYFNNHYPKLSINERTRVGIE